MENLYNLFGRYKKSIKKVYLKKIGKYRARISKYEISRTFPVKMGCNTIAANSGGQGQKNRKGKTFKTFYPIFGQKITKKPYKF